VAEWCTAPRSGWPSWRILLPSGVMVSPVPAQERLRGWPCGSFPFGHRPYAGPRVQLTEGRRVHNSGRGDVLSSWVPTAPGMVLQRTGWWHSGGDGYTGPSVMEETRSTGLTSRCCPVWAQDGCLCPFRGFHRPLSWVWRAGHTGVGGEASLS
jgi:hypothetical protein